MSTVMPWLPGNFGVRQLAAALRCGNSPQAQLAALTLVARLWTVLAFPLFTANVEPPASWREPASQPKQRQQAAALQDGATKPDQKNLAFYFSAFCRILKAESIIHFLSRM